MPTRRAKDLVRHRAPRIAHLVKQAQRRVQRGDPQTEGLDRAWELVPTMAPGMQVVVDADGVWLREASGLTWRHVPNVFGPFLGLQRGEGFEAAEVAYLQARLGPGSVMVDIGANIGLFSVRLAALVPGLRVIAIEPAPTTHAALVANIARNDVADAVTPVAVAMGDEEGEVLMTANLHAANHVIPVDRDATSPDEQRVRLTTLDRLAGEHELDRLDVLKLDVEGLELQALRGARATLERFRPVILAEVEERWAARYGYAPTDVFDLLADLGYGYERFVDDEVRPASGSVAADLAEGNNFAFVPAG